MDTSPQILLIAIFQFVILLSIVSGLQYFICRRYQRMGWILPCLCCFVGVIIMIMIHSFALHLEMDEKIIVYILGFVFSFSMIMVTSGQYYFVYKKKDKV